MLAALQFARDNPLAATENAQSSQGDQTFCLVDKFDMRLVQINLGSGTPYSVQCLAVHLHFHFRTNVNVLKLHS